MNNTCTSSSSLWNKRRNRAHIEVLLLTNTEGDRGKHLLPAKRMKVGSVVSLETADLKQQLLKN